MGTGLPHLSLTGLDWVIGEIALLANIAFGLYLAIRPSRKGSSEDFFLAGRRLTWPVVGASLLATNIGAEHMVGLCGDAYRYGFCAGAIELTAGFSLGIAVAFLIPYYIKNQVFTIPEFLEIRYRKEARLFFSGMMLVICVVTKMAFCLYAGAWCCDNCSDGRSCRPSRCWRRLRQSSRSLAASRWWPTPMRFTRRS